MQEFDQTLSRKSHSSPSVVLCSIILIFAAALPLGQIYLKNFNNTISGDESYALFHSSGIGSFESQETIFEAKDVHESMQQSGGLEEIWATQYNFDTHPPLYFLLLSAQKYIFDGSLLSAKFVSYIFYVLSVFILYGFLRVSRFPYPFTATLLYATAFLVRNYSTAIRPNMMVTALVLAVFTLIFVSINAEKTHRSKSCLLGFAIGLCAGAAFLTHYLSIFSLASALVLLLVFGYRNKLLILTAYATVAIIAVIGIYLAAHQIQNYPGNNGPFLGFNAVWRYALYNLMLFSGYPVTYLGPIFNFVANELVFFPIAVSLILASLKLFSTRRELDARFWVLIIGGAVAPTLGFLLLGLVTGKGVLGARFFLFASPFLAIILGYFVGLTMTKNRFLGMGVMILIIGIGLARNVESRLNPVLFSRSQIVADGINSTPRKETLVLLGVNFKSLNWLGSLIYPLESDVKIRITNRNEKPSQIIEGLYPFKHVWVIFVPIQLNNSNDIEMLKSLKEQDDFRLMSEFKSTFHFQRSN